MKHYERSLENKEYLLILRDIFGDYRYMIYTKLIKDDVLLKAVENGYYAVEACLKELEKKETEAVK